MNDAPDSLKASEPGDVPARREFSLEKFLVLMALVLLMMSFLCVMVLSHLTVWD